MNEFFVEAKTENLSVVLDFINMQLDDCAPKVKNQIGIAIDEIFSNIARYAYRPDVGPVTVRVAVEHDITIEFEDHGKPFNPLLQDNPDISLPLEEREIGGLGIFMVKNIMDSVQYRREGNKNILTIQKKLPSV